MSRYISTVDLSKEDWLKLRLPFIGASEVSALLGMNEYRSPFDLWREKTGDPSFIQFTGNEFTKWGNRLEDSIAQGFAEDYGFKIQKDNKLRIHDNEVQSCSLDRLIVGGTNGHSTPGILEIKNMSSYSYDKMLKDHNDIPLMYYTQHQQQFGVTGYTWGYFVMLIGGNNLVVKEMKADPDYIKLQEETVVSWFNKYVKGKTPPDLIVVDLKNPSTTKLTSEIQVASVEAFNAHQTLEKISASIKEFEAQKKALQKILIEELGTAKELQYEGSKIAYWSEFKQFSSAKMKELNPDEYNKPEYKQTQRKFMTKEYVYEAAE